MLNILYCTKLVPGGVKEPHAGAQSLGNRFAIAATDTHHADGVRDLYQDDEDTLHICFCDTFSRVYSPEDRRESQTKFCFPHGSSDEEEIDNVAREVPHRIEEFRPELIYWLCGMDTHEGLSPTGQDYETTCRRVLWRETNRNNMPFRKSYVHRIPVLSSDETYLTYKTAKS